MTPNPFETLMAEHRQIERVLGALEAYARRLESADDVEHGELARFATFLQQYADALHHGKEEDLLFETMVEAGFPRESGPVAVMRVEHERGRGLVRTLAALGARADWAPVDRVRASEAALELAGLLRTHILKEDRILYPMAEQRMAHQAVQQLAERVEANRASLAARQRELEALGLSLEERWARGPLPVTPEPLAAGCECCSGRSHR